MTRLDLIMWAFARVSASRGRWFSTVFSCLFLLLSLFPSSQIARAFSTSLFRTVEVESDDGDSDDGDDVESASGAKGALHVSRHQARRDGLPSMERRPLTVPLLHHRNSSTLPVASRFE